jgi:hypothetical protein
LEVNRYRINIIRTSHAIIDSTPDFETWIWLPCGSLKLPHGAVVKNGTVFHLKRFAKFLINLKIIKIIIIKN